MNNPSPLVPQGSLLERSRGNSNVRLAIFTILAVHVVLLSGLLMLGCKREAQQVGNTDEVAPASYFPPYTNDLPALVQHYLDDVPPVVHTDPEPAREPQPVRTSPPPPTIPSVPPAAAPIVAPTVSAPPPVMTPAPVTFVPPPEMREYKVLPRDTLSGIAAKHGVSLKVVQDANPSVDPRRLQPGQTILLPPATAKTAITEKKVEAPVSSDVATYVVKAGDNLTKIATSHGITVAQLKTMNNLTGDRIQVGQQLKVPNAKSMATNSASRNGIN